jgi:hypothetical protein
MNPPAYDIVITEGHTTAKVEPRSAAGMMFLQIFYPIEFHQFISSGNLILIKDGDWHSLLARLELSKLFIKKVSSKSKS